MTKTTPSANASFEPTKPFEKVISPPGRAVDTTTDRHNVISIEDHKPSLPVPPPGYIPIRDLVDEFEKDPAKLEAMEEARRWVRGAFYAEDGDTVRTLRLRKGWSQARLARELGTSQSHVARIERGTENLLIETCRRLCAALDIDMNTLDQALRRHEAIAQERANSK